MSSSGNLMQIGLSGVLTSQRAMATTSHNIANAGVAGYSRQRVTMGAEDPVYAGGNYIGSGVKVLDIRRNYDQFLSRELQSATSAATGERLAHTLASDLDNLFGSSDTGLAPVLQGFFDALEDAAGEPSSPAARQVLLDQSERLAERFGTLNVGVERSHESVRGRAAGVVAEINELAQSVAGLNLRISETQGHAIPNDLLDQRDELVRQISERVAVTTLEQDDGSINLFIGSGQSLVVGTQASRLSVAPSAADTSRTGVLLTPGGAAAPLEVTGEIHGGALGALVDFEQGMLADVERVLGQVALGVASAVNAQHRMGMDQNGLLGGDLFTPVNTPALTAARAVAHSANRGGAALSVSVDDPGRLADSDYLLAYDGAAYSLVRQADGQLVDRFASLPRGFAGEGFSIELTAGAMASGDSFVLRPAAGAARHMAVVVPDARSLALAAPVRTAADVDNLGDASIGAASVTGMQGAPLAAPVALTYDAAGRRLVAADPPGGALAYDPATDSGATLTLSIPGFGDVAFTMRGVPRDGDRFGIEANTGGVGDNGNALALGALAAERLLFDGSSTLSQGYERLVSEVATRTQGLGMEADSREILLTRAEEQRAAQSGVNLDEEAANLLRYQQAYEASAQVIQVSNDIFQTLLQALG